MRAIRCSRPGGSRGSRISSRTIPRTCSTATRSTPSRYTLTYSDATLLEGLVGTPFIAAGVDALVVSNVIFLAAFPICGLAFFYTGWRLTADLRAAFVSGLLGALYPFHLEHYSHLELQYLCFVPLATLALLQLIAAPRWRRGVVLGALLALQWLACMYFGVMLPRVPGSSRALRHRRVARAPDARSAALDRRRGDRSRRSALRSSPSPS